MHLREHTPYAAPSWLITCLSFLILVPPASTQDSFAFLQPLPTPVQCQTYAFAWTGGTPTYTLSISVSLPWNASYGIYPLTGDGFPWVLPVPAGHTVSFLLRDNASHVASAGPLTIQPSDDTSCFDSASSSAGSTTTTSSTTTSSTTTSSTTTSSSTTSSTTDPPTTTPSSSVTSTSTSSTSTSLPPSPSPLTESLSSTSQPLSTSDTTGSTPIIATTILVTPTASTSNTSPIPNRATLSTGAIAGLAIAGTAVLVLAGVIVWFCRRRKRRPSSVRDAMDAAGSDMSKDSSGEMSGLRSGGGPQMPMSEAMTSAHRLGPFPAAPTAPPSSSSDGSDPFASSISDGSCQHLLPTGSEDHDYALASYRGPWDGAASVQPTRRDAALFPSPSPGVPIVGFGVQGRSLNTIDFNSMPKSSRTDFTTASPHRTLPTDTKPDSLPRDLPIPPSRPLRGVAQRYAAVPTDERTPSEIGTRAQLMRFEEDGGVRLAGGLPGEMLDEDGSDSGGWVVQPPPYQRFR